MNISHVIAHQLEKKQYERDVVLQLRADELVVSAPVVKLLDQVRQLYKNKSGRGYGQFEPDRFLTRELKELGEGRVEFVEFSRRCMSDLSSRISEANLATGGYVIFVEYEQGGREFLMIVMLKSTPGLTFDRALEVLDVEHLDLNRLHFAARVDLTEWRDDGERYISFVKGRANEITSYFKAFIGVTEYTEARASTRQLVNAVIDFCNQPGMEPGEAELLKDRVHSYLKNKQQAGEPVYIESLSSFIDEENPNRFLEFANELEISDEVEIDKSALRGLVKYYGRDADISVSFTARAYYARRVTFDEAEDVLVIKGVPESLRAQLKPE